MKNKELVSVFLFLTLALAGCGGTSGEEDDTQQSSSQITTNDCNGFQLDFNDATEVAEAAAEEGVLGGEESAEQLAKIASDTGSIVVVACGGTFVSDNDSVQVTEDVDTEELLDAIRTGRIGLVELR